MAEKAFGIGPIPTPGRAIALAMLGRIGEAQTTLASMEPRGENYFIAQLIVGKAAGEDSAKLYARFQKVPRKSGRYSLWDITDAVGAALSGNRAEANRQAAALDARPAGDFLLAVVVNECQCGAPFDLDATPNFKARLAESGLHWPPPQTIHYPPRKQASAP